MRDGNRLSSEKFDIVSLVLRLPMRDGNPDEPIEVIDSRLVLRLPMRDGNLAQGLAVAPVGRFLDYL